MTFSAKQKKKRGKSADFDLGATARGWIGNTGRAGGNLTKKKKKNCSLGRLGLSLGILGPGLAYAGGPGPKEGELQREVAPEFLLKIAIYRSRHTASLPLLETRARGLRPCLSDFSSPEALRLWRLFEAESTLFYRRSYVYDPASSRPNLFPESRLHSASVAQGSLRTKLGVSKSILGLRLEYPSPIQMRGSLYKYRRAQSRAMLSYFRFRGLRERHLSLLFRNYLSRSLGLSERGRMCLLPAACRVFFFFRAQPA